MRVLITGITGMVGSHLADYILANHPKVKIDGLIRWRSPRENVKHLADKVRFVHGDLHDYPSLRMVLGACHYDWIFHLAAQSHVPYSYQVPVDTLMTNGVGTLNLLEAMLCSEVDRIHICSSSEVYGQVTEDDIPITELCPLRPVSPYGVSKATADLLGYQYFQSWGLKTIRTRAFTHTGQRRGDSFAASAFAKQIAEIEVRKRENPIWVGNLDSVRTWCDVRDMVRAYWLAMEVCIPGEVYNIGGIEQHTVGEVLEMLKRLARSKIEHEVSEQLLRPADVTLQIPDTSKFIKQTGWKPEIPLNETLTELLYYHRIRM